MRLRLYVLKGVVERWVELGPGVARRARPADCDISFTLIPYDTGRRARGRELHSFRETDCSSSEKVAIASHSGAAVEGDRTGEPSQENKVPWQFLKFTVRSI